mmetsp:Transcript_21355/g.61015  ORF Transcript_21355/g.61015 Transcript_21355/m.61015 type:complete len:353 (-) Transcript_21355:97-1155(-)
MPLSKTGLRKASALAAAAFRPSPPAASGAAVRTSAVDGDRLLKDALAAPSKVACTLDWYKRYGGTVLTMNVHSDRLSLAVGSHPSAFQASTSAAAPPAASSSALAPLDSAGRPSCPITPLAALPLDRKTRVPQSTIDDFLRILHDHHVAGCVVAWPIQADTGRMGASCGRTLFCLEQLVVGMHQHDQHCAKKLRMKHLPFCLWNEQHHHRKPKNATMMTNRLINATHSIVYPLKLSKRATPARTSDKTACDQFGRCPTYNRTSTKSVHHARLERYFTNESTQVSTVWDAFCQIHWPDEVLSLQQQQQQQQQQNNDDTDMGVSVATTSSSSTSQLETKKRMLRKSKCSLLSGF